MNARIDDPALDVTPDSVLVLRNAGPLGGPGMPEWGMLPIPKKLLEHGVRDMVRISDARMSGTAYGTCVLHVAPESFVGGPLALVQTGDLISLDVPGRRLDLRVSEEELASRRSVVGAPRVPRHPRLREAVRAARHPGPPGLRLRLPPRRRRRPRARNSLMQTPWDVVVVGGGILGLATARELLHRTPDARVLVLEREHEIAAHQTGHNSGVIHAGIYYKPGSLKAKLCAEGRDALYAYCDANDVPYERCGKLIIALDDSELGPLDELERRGIENGVPGLRRLDRRRDPRDRTPRRRRGRPPQPRDGHHRLRRRSPSHGARNRVSGRNHQHGRRGPLDHPPRRRPRSSPPARATSPRPARSRARASGPTAWPKPPATTRTRGSSPSEAATRSSSPKPATSSKS